MKKELELELVKKYPKILRDYGGNPMQTCMAWGVDVESGWYELLDDCLHKLQYFCDLSSAKEKPVQVIATQLKEKYGILAFYFTGEGGTRTDWDIIDDIINEAERKSAYTCEVTGKHGDICQKWGWYKTLCYEEARKLGYVACDKETEEYWKKKDAKGEKNDDDDSEAT